MSPGDDVRPLNVHQCRCAKWFCCDLDMSVCVCVCWSDGGADRGHSLGVHQHAGEGEQLDGSTNEEESHREGQNN